MPQPTTNNLDGWEKTYKEKFSYVPVLLRMAIRQDVKDWLNKVNQERDKEIIQFISDLRKHDMEELIKKIPAFGVIIKDYYNK